MNEVSVWWKVYVFKVNENRILLNKLVRELHPEAPEILLEHVNALIGSKGKATVTGGGAELILTRGETKHEGGMHHQIFVSFPLGDYGLAEFDRISASLTHSTPVAAAIELIKREEALLPPLRASLPLESGAPQGAVHARNQPPMKQPNERPRTFRQAFMDGWNGTGDSS
ncbi:hypothetical protein QNO08_11050 [Arthrobacter sp. zg-Y820]|uniref:hypothetical protein n=1 Tax=unclassified Arthrobacter TaxID=235627 RepID=UPI001E5A56D0|nr:MULTISPECIES: hypothetical protein [unclassified Arthrobacter]MCC9196341.1 hypothetical protein [Arthrobacter sp. zg-Y820]MDK1279202.1 hypothetical protein [Arthrobacter sp. zg.Y820]WIB08399.1 hypothetical protein QNO08_11050 [Arthrobacter sp. zg-Y820]